MDLEDSFTEKLLTRRKATAAFISKKKAGTPVKSGKKRAALIEEQQISEPAESNEDESPKRQCMDVKGKENGHEDQSRASASKGLAALRRRNDQPAESNEDESPKRQCIEAKGKENGHKDQSKASASRGLAALRRRNDQPDEEETTGSSSRLVAHPLPTYHFSTNGSELCGTKTDRSTRFNNLAANINQWEDDLRPSSNERALSAKPIAAPSAEGVKRGGGKLGGKIDAWNQAVQAALETEKKSSSVKGNETVKSVSRDLFPKQPSSTIPDVQKDKILPNAVGRSTSSKSSVLDHSLDPAELPLSARKALFEKSLFGSGRGADHEQPKLSIAQRAAMFEQAAANSCKPIGKKVQLLTSPVKCEERKSPVKASPMKSLAPLHASPVKPVQASPVKSVEASPLVQKHVRESPVKENLSPMKEVSCHVRLIQQQLTDQQRTVTWQDEQRKKEVEELANRHQRRQLSSHATSEDEQSDSMHEETEYLEEEGSGSEMESVCTERESELDSRMTQEELCDEEEPSVADPMEVFNPEEEQPCVEPEGNEKRVQNIERIYRQVEFSNPDSDASSIRSSSVSSSYVSQSPSCSSLSSTGSGEGKVDTPLQYTVSMYRRQKQTSRTTTPPCPIVRRREPVEVAASEDATEHQRILQEQIKELQEEILRQQVVIGQTSQALNLCHATAEFSGSIEQVEGERLLLMATQKRQACLNEIQRLKSLGAQKGSVSEGIGTMTVTDIQLPLKREFIAAQLEGKLNDAVHCFVCLIRFGPRVIVTQVLSTDDKISDGALCFTDHFPLRSLPPDFSAVFEVYALQTKKESLPHEKKYHIKRDQSKIRLTPKKGKKTDSKLIHPTIQSPGGPNTVRSSSFGVVGFTRFTIQNCHKKCFTLEKVPFTSPLEGVLKVDLKLYAENKVTEKGFLSMFELVTGLGAWHRRWCYLDGQYLKYWKYPYHEQEKEPIGMIDLKKCVTGEVKLVPRDVCARPNTFELSTVSPKENKKAPVSITKHLLAADTKEERILWCSRLNEALTNVRKWDTQSLMPLETDAFVYPTFK